MFRTKRESDVLQAMRLHGSCSVAELARQLVVSEETVRRAVKPLVAQGLLTKVHGAVMLTDYHAEPPFQRRLQEHRDAKIAIATALAQHIHDGDSLMIDTGTTTAYVARALTGHINLVVVTNSVEIARTLGTRGGNRVYMTGGELRADDGAAFGPAAIDFLRQFHVDYAILSIGAIDARGAFMNFHLCEGEVSRAVIDQAERVIVVADRSKFGRRAPVKVCDADAVDMLITDGVPRRTAQLFSRAGVEVITA